MEPYRTSTLSMSTSLVTDEMDWVYAWDINNGAQKLLGNDAEFEFQQLGSTSVGFSLSPISDDTSADVYSATFEVIVQTAPKDLKAYFFEGNTIICNIPSSDVFKSDKKYVHQTVQSTYSNIHLAYMHTNKIGWTFRLWSSMCEGKYEA